MPCTLCLPPFMDDIILYSRFSDRPCSVKPIVNDVQNYCKKKSLQFPLSALPLVVVLTATQREIHRLIHHIYLSTNNEPA